MVHSAELFFTDVYIVTKNLAKFDVELFDFFFKGGYRLIEFSSYSAIPCFHVGSTVR